MKKSLFLLLKELEKQDKELEREIRLEHRREFRGWDERFKEWTNEHPIVDDFA